VNLNVVDDCTRLKNENIQSRKTPKTTATYWKPHEYYKLKRARFLYLACQGGGQLAPCPSVTPHVFQSFCDFPSSHYLERVMSLSV